MNLSEEDLRFSVQKVNRLKVYKTLRGSIKKGIFYLGLKIPYEVTENLVGIQIQEQSEEVMKRYFGEIYELFILDSKIRFYDDILDNVLAKISPMPIQEMRKVIDLFRKDVGSNQGDVPELFEKEINLMANLEKFTVDETKDIIKNIIDIRPCDYFIILEKLTKIFGTKLSDKDYIHSINFLKEFQRLRDLLDDMMSIEEDTIKNDYNSIVLAKRKEIPYDFFETIVREKISKMKKIVEEIKDHSNKCIFYDTINFWEEEYKNLFKVLLVNYYINIEEFRKSYFMIKQL